MTDGWTVPSGGNAFPFDALGAWVKLRVEEFEPNLPVTDLKTGEPKRYPSGGPILMHRIGGTIVESSDPAQAPGSAASVYMSGAMKPTGSDANGPYGARNAVIAAAIKSATGGNQLMPGGILTVQYVGDEPDTPRGMSPTKRYQAWYEYTAPPLGAVGPTAPAASPAPASGPPAAAATPVLPPAELGATAAPSPSTAGPAPAGLPTSPTPAVAPAGPSSGPSPTQTGAPTAAAATVPVTPGSSDAEAAAEAALAAYLAAQATAEPDWSADPRVAPLRAKGLGDDVIRSILKL